MTAAAWGGLAFLLTLAARENNRSTAASAYHAWTRSCCLAGCIELVQLFTISHVADGQDLARAWLACTAGTLAATALMWIRPLIHRDPAPLVAPAVTVLCPLLFCWFTISAFRSIGGGQGAEPWWLPIMGNFDRSWDGLLADYASGFISYVMAICALLVWLRFRGPAPRLIHCLAAGLMAALTLQGIGLLFFGHSPDTAHFALAIVAAGLVHRLDRAMAGRIVGALPPSSAAPAHVQSRRA